MRSPGQRQQPVCRGTKAPSHPEPALNPAPAGEAKEIGPWLRQYIEPKEERQHQLSGFQLTAAGGQVGSFLSHCCNAWHHGSCCQLGCCITACLFLHTSSLFSKRALCIAVRRRVVAHLTHSTKPRCKRAERRWTPGSPRHIDVSACGCGACVVLSLAWHLLRGRSAIRRRVSSEPALPPTGCLPHCLHLTHLLQANSRVPSSRSCSLIPGTPGCRRFPAPSRDTSDPPHGSSPCAAHAARPSLKLPRCRKRGSWNVLSRAQRGAEWTRGHSSPLPALVFRRTRSRQQRAGDQVHSLSLRRQQDDARALRPPCHHKEQQASERP